MACNVSNVNTLCISAYVGKIHYLIDHSSDISTYDLNKMSINITVFGSIIESLNKTHEIKTTDISNHLDNSNFNGSVLYAISPFIFLDLYDENYGYTNSYILMTRVLDEILPILTEDSSIKYLCLEYLGLLHDIYWHKITKEDIIEILYPELDLLESEVICSNDERQIFLSAIWCFIFSDDYVSCYDKAANLSNTNSDIVGVACILSGLYYGTDSIPTDWCEEVFETLTLPLFDIDES